MALVEQLVGVAALGGVERIEPEVIEDEQIDGEELAKRGLVGVIEARVLELREHLVGGERQHGVAMAAGEPAKRVGEKGLADADGADQCHVRMGVEEAQRHELIPERAVVGDLRARIPLLERHGRIELRLGGSVPTDVIRGTVASVAANVRTVSAQLDGAAVPTPGIAYPAVITPVVGDDILVLRRRDGFLLLLHVLGRD